MTEQREMEQRLTDEVLTAAFLAAERESDMTGRNPKDERDAITAGIQAMRAVLVSALSAEAAQPESRLAAENAALREALENALGWIIGDAKYDDSRVLDEVEQICVNALQQPPKTTEPSR